VRLPEAFPNPDVPIIMLTGHGERSRVVEAMRIGIDEFLLKPVSSKALQDRLFSVLVEPRAVVQIDDEERRVGRPTASIQPDGGAAIANLTLLN
jgi:FixJ family two-component response regulator